MNLSFTGQQASSPEFETLLLAFDGDKRVVVITSQEAIEDFGLAAVQAKASQKYEAGMTEADGRVRVFTVDLS